MTKSQQTEESKNRSKKSNQCGLNTADIVHIKEDLEKISSTIAPNSQDSLKLNNVLINRLIEKEVGICAKKNNIEMEELAACLSLKPEVPNKIILWLLRTANQHSLDLLQEEVIATKYEDRWQVIISVDGWIKLMQSNPHFSGITFTESSELDNGLPKWMECTIYRDDRIIPISTREYLNEVMGESPIWEKMPRRMLRHRTLQQCARLAFGVNVNHEVEKEVHEVRCRLDLNPKNSSGSEVNNKDALNQNGDLTQVEKLKKHLFHC